MKKSFRQILALSLILTISATLSGCYDAYGIEELAYVVAIGLDTCTDGALELTVQIATSGESSSGDQGSSESTSQSKKSNITSIKCNSINSRFGTH